MISNLKFAINFNQLNLNLIILLIATIINCCTLTLVPSYIYIWQWISVLQSTPIFQILLPTINWLFYLFFFLNLKFLSYYLLSIIKMLRILNFSINLLLNLMSNPLFFKHPLLNKFVNATEWLLIKLILIWGTVLYFTGRSQNW